MLDVQFTEVDLFLPDGFQKAENPLVSLQESGEERCTNLGGHGIPFAEKGSGELRSGACEQFFCGSALEGQRGLGGQHLQQQLFGAVVKCGSGSEQAGCNDVF
ncbi:MAG: hypothetical protein ACK5YO_15750, partial [Planctomyces sp.]